jgi:hypothetical protein
MCARYAFVLRACGCVCARTRDLLCVLFVCASCSFCAVFFFQPSDHQDDSGDDDQGGGGGFITTTSGGGGLSGGGGGGGGSHRFSSARHIRERMRVREAKVARREVEAR